VTDAVQLAPHPDGTLPRTLIVALSGELDHTNAEVLRVRTSALLTSEYDCLVLDLAELTFCDSTGIRVFLTLRALVDDRGGTIALTDLRPRLSKVFQITGLVQLFAVRPTLVDVLALLRTQPPAP
jgi:anti-sigma B factor antagonist